MKKVMNKKINGYKIRDQRKIHFVTFTVIEWINVFTREEYRILFVSSLHHCQKYKGLKIYGWCIMYNHVHMLVSASNGNLSSVIRDLKSFTSKKIIEKMRSNPKDPRKQWMIPIFELAGISNSRNTNCQFWIHGNHPIEINDEYRFYQRLNYIHQNPVKAKIVSRPEDYVYSSARDYCGKNGLVDIDRLGTD